MNTDLPERAEYYRPSRARELRGTAARLERRARGIERLAKGTWVAIGVGALALALLVLLRQIDVFGAVLLAFSAVAFLVVGSIGEIVAESRLDRRIAECRRQAEALSADHCARYGSSSLCEEGAE